MKPRERRETGEQDLTVSFSAEDERLARLLDCVLPNDIVEAEAMASSEQRSRR